MSDKYPLNVVTSRWLETTNKEFLDRGIAASDRVRRAIQKWRRENAQDITALSDDDLSLLSSHHDTQIEKIKSYFFTETNKKAGYIGGPVFVGVYYYQGDFWEATVPEIWGQRPLYPFRNLAMPGGLKNLLAGDKEMKAEYLSFYADCVDYGYSIMEMSSFLKLTELASKLFISGDEHLKAIGAQLTHVRPNSKAILDAAMVAEIFLKASIATKRQLTDDKLLIKISHNLGDAIELCISDGVTELSVLKNQLVQLPKVSARYAVEERTFGELWSAYRLVHKTAVAVLRPLLGRDCRKAFGV